MRDSATWYDVNVAYKLCNSFFMKPFLVGEIIKSSYEMFKRQWRLLLGVVGILFVVDFAFSLASEFTEEQWQMAVVVGVIGIGVSVMLQLGIIRIILNLVDGKPVEIGQLTGEPDKFWRFVGASIVYGFIVVIGLILLVVPGIIWSIKYGQYKMLIVDKNMGVMESIRESAKITYGAKSQLFVLGLAFAGLFLLAIIPLLLGLIVVVPMAIVSPAIVYRKLLAAQAGAPSGAVAVPADTQKPFVPLGGSAETESPQQSEPAPAPEGEQQKENQ